MGGVTRPYCVHLSGLATPAVAGQLQANKFGELDCNGQSTMQSSSNNRLNCTDIRGFDNTWNPNTWDGRFYDNGRYIGHDEPDMTFLSNQAGSGDNVTWTETLPRDPKRAPTVKHPGSDVSHWFELSVAPWFSMAMCDPNSYPQAACTPESDSNAPTCVVPIRRTAPTVAVQRSWRCSSTRRASRRSSTRPAATTPIGAPR